jgi:tRNA nucleotidyltransferase (CCA-adding enzyme)
LMARCAGLKRDGGQCTATVEPLQSYCWWHDPANADKRKAAARRGGKAKANREIVNLKKQLEDLVADVLEGRVERGTAAVVNQLLNTELRAIELERKIREQDEVLERLETLEAQKGMRRWG